MRRERPTIAAHGLRVAQLAARVCDALAINADERDLTVTAALLHDVGKIRVPERILFKSSELTRVEFALLKAHALDGEHIVYDMTGDRRLATIVGQHHERLDGRGYPRGLGSDAIDPLSRIVTVVDAYVAMREERPYSPARSCRDALYEISRNSGSQFSATCVDVVIQLVA